MFSLTKTRFPARWGLVTVILAIGIVGAFFATQVASADSVLVDNNTQGYYNAAIGETLSNGTLASDPFPPRNSDPSHPAPQPEPDTSAASSILGNWLDPDPLPLDPDWSGLQAGLFTPKRRSSIRSMPD